VVNPARPAALGGRAIPAGGTASASGGGQSKRGASARSSTRSRSPSYARSRAGAQTDEPSGRGSAGSLCSAGQMGLLHNCGLSPPLAAGIVYLRPSDGRNLAGIGAAASIAAVKFSLRNNRSGDTDRGRERRQAAPSGLAFQTWALSTRCDLPLLAPSGRARLRRTSAELSGSANSWRRPAPPCRRRPFFRSAATAAAKPASPTATVCLAAMPPDERLQPGERDPGERRVCYPAASISARARSGPAPPCAPRSPRPCSARV
jgi:hypothetical protein